MSSTAVITLNAVSGAGWGTGMLTVTNAAGSITGPVKFVVQLTSPGPPLPTIIARGMWVGTVRDLSGTPTGDLSVQNFELQGTTQAFTGSWGSGPNFPDLSVKTTKVRC